MEKSIIGPDIITLSKTVTLEDFEDKYARDVCVCASTGKKVTLCYNEFGNPGNPLVMLVAGLSTQGVSIYETCVCKWLANQNYYVVRFDNRDTGLSTKFDDVPQNCSLYKLLLPKVLAFGEKIPYSLNDMAEDAIALMKHLGHPKAHWVGTSMGGMIVQLVEISHPEACLSATLIMTMSGNTHIAMPSFKVQFALLRWMKCKNHEELVRLENHILQNYRVGKWPVDISISLQASKEAEKRSTWVPDAPRHLCAVVRSPPRDELLKKVNVPTLILHGKLDKLCPVPNAYHMHSLIPNSELAIFDEMGHFVDYNHLHPVYERVVKFLQAHDS